MAQFYGILVLKNCKIKQKHIQKGASGGVSNGYLSNYSEHLLSSRSLSVYIVGVNNKTTPAHYSQFHAFDNLQVYPGLKKGKTLRVVTTHQVKNRFRLCFIR